MVKQGERVYQVCSYCPNDGTSCLACDDDGYLPFDLPGIDLAALVRLLAETPDAREVLSNLLDAGANACMDDADTWVGRDPARVALGRRSTALGRTLVAALKGGQDG